MISFSDHAYAQKVLGLSASEADACVKAAPGPLIVVNASKETSTSFLPHGLSVVALKVFQSSGLSMYDYLRSFTRVPVLQYGEDPRNAKVNALILSAQYRGHPMILLGPAVMTAFGVDSDRIHMHRGSWVLPVVELDSIREAVRKASDLWHNPTGLYERSVCDGCGTLTQAHSQHPNAPDLYMHCSGTGIPYTRKNITTLPDSDDQNSYSIPRTRSHVPYGDLL